MSQFRRPAAQRGASLFGMLFLAIVVAFVLLMAVRVFPSVNEYLTIRKTIAEIMRKGPGSPSDVRSAFAKTIEIEYSIKTIGPQDLVIKPAGDGLRTEFAYNVEIPIVEPVFLLVKYAGSASTPGAGRTP